MTMILDSGALVALERNDRSMWRRLKATQRAGVAPITHGGVVGQVWRGGSGRQALLARAFRAIATIPLDDDLGRRSGLLLARSGLTDAIDAAVVALATHGDQIMTSDPDDISTLVEATGRRVDVIVT